MLFLFQIVVLAFILLSLVLCVTVPVVFASPAGWNSPAQRTLLFSGVNFWVFLLFLIGTLNSFVS